MDRRAECDERRSFAGPSHSPSRLDGHVVVDFALHFAGRSAPAAHTARPGGAEPQAVGLRHFPSHMSSGFLPRWCFVRRSQLGEGWSCQIVHAKSHDSRSLT